MPINSTRVKIGKEGPHNHRLDRFTYNLDQPLNRNTGQPSAETLLSECIVNFAIPLDVSIKDIVSWKNEESQKEVSIDFYDNGQLIKSYTLNKAYLISMKGIVQSDQNGSLKQFLTLHISPLSAKIDNELYEYPEEV